LESIGNFYPCTAGMPASVKIMYVRAHAHCTSTHNEFIEITVESSKSTK
jgi:hypothetical protein